MFGRPALAGPAGVSGRPAFAGGAAGFGRPALTGPAGVPGRAVFAGAGRAGAGRNVAGAGPFGFAAFNCCTAAAGRGLPAAIGAGRCSRGRLCACAVSSGRPLLRCKSCCLASNRTGAGGGAALAITGRWKAAGGGTCWRAGALPSSTASRCGATGGAAMNFACRNCAGSTRTAA